jgi:hypothetical protein
VTVTRLVGGLTPGDGSDPRTFPAIWNATADVIDAVEADSLPTAVGSAVAGDALVYDGAAWVNQPRPGRNLVFNGAMQVHQRGVSFTGITGGSFYTADRWNTFASSGVYTQTVENDAPAGTGLSKSVKILVTTAVPSLAASDQFLFRQILEGQDVQNLAKGTSGAKELTLSFWVKGNVTGIYIAELFDATNTRFVSFPYTIVSANTWEKKVISFPGDTTGVLSNSNAAAFRVQFWQFGGSDFTSGPLSNSWHTTQANRASGQVNFAAATNNYWQITGVQLEVGPVATPFEFKSFGKELAECQRYYYRNAPNAVNKLLGQATVVSTTSATIFGQFPVKMRIAPTALEQSGTANHYAVNAAGTTTTLSGVPLFSTTTTEDQYLVVFTVSSGLVAGHSGRGITDTTNGATAFLGWSAEL